MFVCYASSHCIAKHCEVVLVMYLICKPEIQRDKHDYTPSKSVLQYKLATMLSICSTLVKHGLYFHLKVQIYSREYASLFIFHLYFVEWKLFSDIEIAKWLKWKFNNNKVKSEMLHEKQKNMGSLTEI